MEAARALLAARRFREAWAAAAGVLADDTNRSGGATKLMDEIAMHSAVATGEAKVGFEGGRVLLVRPSSASGAPAAPMSSGHALVFDALADALEAARDGDTLRLLPGVHVTSQARPLVTKRLLIEGAGATRDDVVLDHRANAPALVVARSCIIQRLTIDHVGFVPSVAITPTPPELGPTSAAAAAPLKPVLRDVAVLCSGADAVDAAGGAQPLLQNCALQARRTACTARDAAGVTLWGATLTGGVHGLVVAGSAQAFLDASAVERCGEDGVVVLQAGVLDAARSRVVGCGGPGIDVSDRGSANLRGVDVEQNHGGVWLWDKATCDALGCHISGGPSFAVLLDAEAFARGSGTTVDGSTYQVEASSGGGGGGGGATPPPPHYAPPATTTTTAAVAAGCGSSGSSARTLPHVSNNTNTNNDAVEKEEEEEEEEGGGDITPPMPPPPRRLLERLWRSSSGRGAGGGGSSEHEHEHAPSSPMDGVTSTVSATAAAAATTYVGGGIGRRASSISGASSSPFASCISSITLPSPPPAAAGASNGGHTSEFDDLFLTPNAAAYMAAVAPPPPLVAAADMLTDATVAAALFPPEAGAFALESEPYLAAF